ncbi:MAG TPA: GerMN domain-containing protein [Candidatus Paceibacterota bacterium]|nr:GerMN domain-containing protein [Candidatus Paceibacterota bacterium]
MKKNLITVLLVILVLIIAVALIFFAVRTETAESPNGNASGTASTSMGTSTASPATSSESVGDATNGTNTSAGTEIKQIKIALLDTEGSTTGKQRGCDRVVMVSQNISPTKAPLSAALSELFSSDQTTLDGWYNFMAKTNQTLHFDHATVVNGTANVYLIGKLSGLAGVCDDPRAQIQIEETARQFPTVKNVQIYLNGKKTNLTPSEKGV